MFPEFCGRPMGTSISAFMPESRRPQLSWWAIMSDHGSMISGIFRIFLPGPSLQQAACIPAIQSLRLLAKNMGHVFLRFRQGRREARLRYRLLEFNNHMLRDIGVTEVDIRSGRRSCG